MTKHSLPNLLKAFQNSLSIKKGVTLVSIGLVGVGLSWTQVRAATSTFILPDPAPTPAPAPPSPAPALAPVAPLAQPQHQLSAPSVSVPVPSPPQPIARPLQTGKNIYLDPIGYKPQQTQQAPVVLVERTTGCQTVAGNGQFANSCGSAAQPSQVARRSVPLQQTPLSQLRRERRSPAAAVAVRYPVQPAAIAAETASYTASSASMNKPYYSRATANPPRFKSGQTALLFPLSIPSTISSAFGWRVHPVSGDRRLHFGTDLAAPMGTPVLAAYPGKVEIADFLGGYGLTVVLRHENNTQESRYAHLSESFVRSGDWVDQGAVIGLVGSTGLSTGPSPSL